MTLRTLSWGAGLLAIGLLSGCATGTGSEPSASTTPTGSTGHGNAKHEPRMVVATAQGVSVRSLDTGKVLADLEAGSTPMLTLATDQRHVYATDLASGQTRIVDSGTWTVDHGDHGDPMTADPQLLSTVLTATKPTHVEIGADQIAIYDDATGTASFYDEFAVQDGTSEPVLTITASSPHHGVGLSDKERYLVTTVGAEGDTIAGGVNAYDLTGTLVSSHPGCPGLHGAAVVGTTTVFGCRDGLLTMPADGTVAKLSYPRADDWRVGSFAAPVSADATRFLGHYGPADSTNVLITDLTTGTSTAVDIGSPYGSMLSINEHQVAVAAISGEVVIVDLDTAAVTARHQTIEPWELPQGHSGGAPTLAANGETLYLTDPATQGVSVLDLDSGEVTTIDLGVAATGLVIANPEHADEHDH